MDKLATSDKETERTHRDERGAEEAVPATGVSDTVVIRSVAITGIFLILLFHTLKVASPVLIPITLAYILCLLLAPLVRKLRRLHIPDRVGAAIVLLGFLLVASGGIYSLSAPAQEWTSRVPEFAYKIDQKLRPISAPLKEARDAAEKVSEIAESPNGTEDQTVTVKVKQASWMTDFLSGTPRTIASIGIVIVLMYFLLAGGDSFLNKIVSVMPRLQDKKRAVTIMRDIQKDISHYLLTCTIINTILGLVVAGALYLLGMPNPLLWGALVGVLNFAPYIGPAVSAAIVTVAALLSFPALGDALLVPVVVFGLNILEGQFITPHVIGRRLALSPVVVFIGIVIWGWMWGVAGALMAIPIIAAINVVCQRIEPLNPVADFIGASARHP